MKNNGKIKVLLLDDEFLVRMSVTARLRKTDFEVTGVGTPEEAVEQLRKERFQAIITDVMMGSVDGFMFRDIVRGMDRAIPIIFFTSLVNDDGNAFLNRVMEDVYSYYLPKNSPTEVLAGRLEQAVRAYRAETAMKAMQEDLDGTMRLASFVQTSMLPRWSHVKENVFYGTFWRPYAQVSGDLYEWIPVGKEASLFVFGDISGHGVSASLAMTAVQSYLKQFADLADIRARDVAKIVSQIDRFIYGNFPGVAYMSGLVAYLSAKDNVIRVCNAGCPDVMCFDRTGRRITLNPEKRGGLPMGMVPNAAYTEEDVYECTVPEDAVFFVASDGVTDLSSDADGEERVPDELLEELMREAVKSVEADGVLAEAALPYRIGAMLEDFGFTQPQDDESLMVFGKPRHRPDEFYVEAPMNSARIDAAVRQAGEYLAARPGLASLVPRVELLLGEFLMNLHDHGYEGVTRHKEFALVRLQLRQEDVVISVWHRARPWDVNGHAGTPDAALDRANAVLDNHGRGVAIIRKIARSIGRESFGGLNVNTFYVPIQETGEVAS